MHHFSPAAIAVAALVLCAPAWAQKPSVYPANGQSAEQKGKDDAQCLDWAKKDTGIDPVAVANAPPPPTAPQGERVRGAARGALAGGRRARMKQAAQGQQAQASKAQAMDSYYRAYGACMQGRGYSVK